MSHELIFTILPFDPLVVPNPKIKLPIDVDDLAKQLQEKWHSGEVKIYKQEGTATIKLYIYTQQHETHNVAGFIENYSQFYVTGWPKRIAKELIFWYRGYIPQTYPLFLVIPDRGYVVELTANLTLDDIENMYPFPIPVD